uniref:Uncharacterized protein n=1 Tax=Ditylenchus dipsaci TaxID=166011 RepID=A0A915DTV4_9BILA
MEISNTLLLLSLLLAYLAQLEATWNWNNKGQYSNGCFSAKNAWQDNSEASSTTLTCSPPDDSDSNCHLWLRNKKSNNVFKVATGRGKVSCNVLFDSARSIYTYDGEDVEPDINCEYEPGTSTTTSQPQTIVASTSTTSKKSTTASRRWTWNNIGEYSPGCNSATNSWKENSDNNSTTLTCTPPDNSGSKCNLWLRSKTSKNVFQVATGVGSISCNVIFDIGRNVYTYNGEDVEPDLNCEYEPSSTTTAQPNATTSTASFTSSVSSSKSPSSTTVPGSNGSSSTKTSKFSTAGSSVSSGLSSTAPSNSASSTKNGPSGLTTKAPLPSSTKSTSDTSNSAPVGSSVFPTSSAPTTSMVSSSSKMSFTTSDLTGPTTKASLVTTSPSIGPSTIASNSSSTAARRTTPSNSSVSTTKALSASSASSANNGGVGSSTTKSSASATLTSTPSSPGTSSMTTLIAVLTSTARPPIKNYGDCCPDNGVWSTWKIVIPCSDSCGSCTQTVHSRTCLSQANGCPCTGLTTKHEPCNIAPCKYPRVSCCTNYRVMDSKGQILCGPQAADQVEAPMTTSCQPYGGVWSDWGPWSNCTGVSCNQCGTATRKRTCRSTEFGYTCQGSDTETKACKVVGVWSAWSAPSQCTDSCGGYGTMKMTRTCTTPDCPCSGNSSKISPCAFKPCPPPRSSCDPKYSFLSDNGSDVCSPFPVADQDYLPIEPVPCEENKCQS